MKFLLLSAYSESIIDFRGVLIDDLLRKGITVHVAAPGLLPSSKVYSTLIKKGVALHNVRMNRTGMNPLLELYTVYNLAMLIIKIKPSCVLAYTIKPIIYGGILARLIGVRFFALVTGLGYLFVENRKHRQSVVKRIFVSLYRISLSKASSVIFQNIDDKNLFHDLGIINIDNAHVVNGSGVDLNHYHLSHFTPGIKFLLIARLIASKGIREYVSAAKIVKESCPNASFLLVGQIDESADSISESELDGWIRQGVIEYLGQVDDVRYAISQCSVFVLPTYYREGVPRSILEAMSMGRPIITTNSPGCRETVIDGKNGYFVEPRSADSLSSAMKRFIDEPDLCKVMGDYSRVIAEDKFDVRLVNDKMLQIMKL